jgi:hypothetical protein
MQECSAATDDIAEMPAAPPPKDAPEPTDEKCEKMRQADAKRKGSSARSLVAPLPEVQTSKDRARDDLVDGFLDYLRAERDASR